MKYLLLFLVLSCSHRKEKENLRNQCLGLPIQKLQTHPYFSKLEFKAETLQNDFEVHTYADGRPALTKARAGYGEVWCENIFSVKNDLIIQFQQYGPCPYDKKHLP